MLPDFTSPMKLSKLIQPHTLSEDGNILILDPYDEYGPNTGTWGLSKPAFRMFQRGGGKYVKLGRSPWTFSVAAVDTFVATAKLHRSSGRSPCNDRYWILNPMLPQ